jgi:hypothetical protein
VDSFFDNAFDVVLTDWDRSGTLDILAASYDTGEVSLWRNQGSWIQSTFPLGVTGGANSMAVGDIDLDGSPDLLVAFGDPTGSHDEVQVVLNRMSATIQNVDSTTVDHPLCAALADLDEDGDLDAIVCEFDAGQVSWFENVNGDGETWTKHLAASGNGAPMDAVPHDVDLDGDLDLVVSTFTQVVWLENRLDEVTTTWLSHVVDANVPAAAAVTVGDVDGDGEVEIVAGGINTPFLGYWNRPAVLTNAWTRKTLQSTYPVADVDVADVDQDGDMDILASQFGPNSSLIFWDNTGGDAFVERGLGGSYLTLRSTALGDLDGDGDPDFALATGNTNTILNMSNRIIRSKGNFDADAVESGSGVSPLAYRTMDFDRDGDLDVVSFDSDQVVRWRDSPGDSGTALQSLSSALTTPAAFEVADLDGDGDLDVVLGLAVGLEWLENTGAGPLTRHTIDSSGTIDRVLLGDLGQDNDLDVIGYDSDATRIVWFLNAIEIGTVSNWFELTVENSITTLSALALGDVTVDGELDILAQIDGNVRAYSRIDETSFFTTTAIATASPSYLVAGDFDRDGDEDVAGYVTSGSIVIYWANDGSGGGWTPLNRAFANGVKAMKAADLDLDGYLDLVGASNLGSVVAWNPRGNDPWPTGVDSLAFLPANLLAVDDYSQDGFPDVMILGNSGVLHTAVNRPAQYRPAVPSAPSQHVIEGTTAVLLSIDVTHLGLPGDQEIELKTVEVEVTSLGLPLTGPQVDGLFQELWIRRADTGDILAYQLDPSTASPLVFTVVPNNDGERIQAPTSLGTPSSGAFTLSARLDSDAQDTLSAFELRFPGLSQSEIVIDDVQGTPLRQEAWSGAARFYTVGDAGEILFADGFESGDTTAW